MQCTACIVRSSFMVLAAIAVYSVHRSLLLYPFILIILSILTLSLLYRQNCQSFTISPATNSPARHNAPMLRFNGDKSKLMPNVVQNHHADNSFILPMCSFWYIFRRMLSTV